MAQTDTSGRPLFEPDRHAPLIDTAWDEGAARAAIIAIAEDARRAFSQSELWPIHPDDIEGDDRSPETSLYVGAAGVIWALDHLRREGAIPSSPSFAEYLPAIQERNRRSFDSEAWHRLLGSDWQTRSLLLGESGILLTRWKTGDASALVPLAQMVADNAADPSWELMWGAPGTMLAALAVFRATGIGQWAELCRASADTLIKAFDYDAGFDGHIWTQRLYQRTEQYLGAVHGFAGNAYALIAGLKLLDRQQWGVVCSQVEDTLRRTAIHGDEGVNWAASLGEQAAGRRLLVQHCHGAPGMITALSKLPAPIDDLLRDAGRLTWVAGPLAKGFGLCHGTAGNGFAFLKLYERTGDALWLERARRFAMHALHQSQARAAETGQGRYSLWTGDLGLACYLWECSQATARFPTIDVF